jgi:cell division protease FtsH
MSRTARQILLYVLAGAIVLMVFNAFVSSATEPADLSLNELEQKIEDGVVASVKIKQRSDVVVGEFTSEGAPAGSDTRFKTSYPGEYEDELTALLIDNGVETEIDAENTSFLQTFLFNFGPLLLMVGLIIFFLFQMQGGGNRVMSFGKAKAKQVSRDQPKVTFKDVAGLDEAVEELQEIKEFLESPQKFRAIGAKIPKGVLLYGPPGTGKTLLARAVAGEAGVPFFTISGSDFVEMFVGVGASRVRDLFEQAKTAAPAIIFVDEIDAVGRHRGAGLGGGHDEREQTLNQLLVEMDGFDLNKGVILVAATNRPDILDPALLRPGRFDRQVVVDRPDLKGRQQILEVHARGKPLAPDIDLKVLARQTPGFTGADLANLINEGALLAARRDKDEIGMEELEEAIERVIAGPERKSRVMSDEERKITAYHEGGHALVGFALPMSDPVHKVTIVPRGRAGGYTLALPEEDRNYARRSELVDKLAMLLGGRTAEELVFGDPTTGASNDIEQATNLARKMIMEYGMSDSLGPRRYGTPDAEVFLGRDYTRGQDYSDEVAARIDEEVRFLINQAHEEARSILTAHRDALDRLAADLLEKETLDAKDIEKVLHDVPTWEHDLDGVGRIRAPHQAQKKASDGIAAATTEAS